MLYFFFNSVDSISVKKDRIEIVQSNCKTDVCIIVQCGSWT